MLDPAILVAIISGCGTILGSIVGILAANRMSNYRIEQLEKKVEKHNNVIERVTLVEHDLLTITRRLETIEQERHNG